MIVPGPFDPYKTLLKIFRDLTIRTICPICTTETSVTPLIWTMHISSQGWRTLGMDAQSQLR